MPNRSSAVSRSGSNASMRKMMIRSADSSQATTPRRPQASPVYVAKTPRTRNTASKSPRPKKQGNLTERATKPTGPYYKNYMRKKTQGSFSQEFFRPPNNQLDIEEIDFFPDKVIREEGELWARAPRSHRQSTQAQS